MSDIYYMVGLFIAVFAEQYAFKSSEWRDSIKVKIKTETETWDTETKGYFGIGMMYLVWTFVGLASDHWPVFLLLIAMGVLGGPLKKFAPYRYADASISLAMVLAMVINHFHFKLNPLSIFQ